MHECKWFAEDGAILFYSSLSDRGKWSHLTEMSSIRLGESWLCYTIKVDIANAGFLPFQQINMKDWCAICLDWNEKS